MFPPAESAYNNYPDQYLDNLPAYNLNEGVVSLLDITRMFFDSENYMCSLVASPKGADVNIGPRLTFVENIPLEPFTYIVSLTVFSDQPEGFKLRIYDKGARADIIERQFIFHNIMGSIMEMQFSPAPTPVDVPFGQHFFQSPIVVMPPGSLQVEITNLSPATAIIQIVLGCAVPVTDRSLNNVLVEGAIGSK